MASGQTTNFGLNQWAAEDKVIRTEFNEDNAKIDAALPRIVTGSYQGTGTQEKLHIAIGKRPKLVILTTNNSRSSGSWVVLGIVWEGTNLFVSSATAYAYLNQNLAITLQNDGFTIDHSKWSAEYGFNALERTTSYWVWC